MIQALKIAGVELRLGGMTAGFPWGGEAKADGRTMAPPADLRVLAVGKG